MYNLESARNQRYFVSHRGSFCLENSWIINWYNKDARRKDIIWPSWRDLSATSFLSFFSLETHYDRACIVARDYTGNMCLNWNNLLGKGPRSCAHAELASESV